MTACESLFYIVRMKSASVHVRLKPETKDFLERQAKAEGRTMSNLIQFILDERAAAAKRGKR